jgi:hypothetical protein
VPRSRVHGALVGSSRTMSNTGNQRWKVSAPSVSIRRPANRFVFAKRFNQCAVVKEFSGETHQFLMSF